MKSSKQLKGLIRNKSKELSIPANVILRNIMFEFFLEKLDASRYRKNFIIKGGFLISSMVKIASRTTMDLDVTIKKLKLSKSGIEKIINEILNIETNPLLKMELTNISEITESSEYPGLRVTISVIFDIIKEIIKIDITTGDQITPKEINYEYYKILDSSMIHLYSYNLETILAEKMETILSRGTDNTRMRDFYDVLVLYQLKVDEIDFRLLKKALEDTSKYRNTSYILENASQIIDELIANKRLKELWESYQNNYSYAKDIPWIQIMEVFKIAYNKIGVR